MQQNIPGVDFQFLSTLSLRRATILTLFRHLLLQFLSTLSLRRATRSRCLSALAARYFYPRSPCGERRLPCMIWSNIFLISIHALLAESDVLSCGWCGVTILFLSTLSLRRATPWDRVVITSLHHFYPRSPCGERRLPICKYGLPLIFLSTLSLRRATPVRQGQGHRP